MKASFFFFALCIVWSSWFTAGCSSSARQEEQVLKEGFVLSDSMLSTTEFATADSLRLRNELKFFGKVSADHNKMVEVFPVVGGNVLNVFVELGDYVEKGQVLATIRSAEVAGFEKELLDAQNDVLVAQNNLKVAQELFEGKLKTEREVIEANNELEKARSQLNRVQEIYRIYSLKPGSVYEVRAPISGFIVQKEINQDMQLRSDHTDNIFDIARIDEVWILANVNESDIGLIRLGEEAQVTTISYPGKIFTGKVDKIYNFIDPDTKTMKIRIRMQNPGYLLKPEMRASVKLGFDEDSLLIAVPSGAIIFDKNKYFVVVYKDRYHLESREVKVYRELGETTWLASGLKVGEQVVTRNQLFIYDALND